MSTETALCWLRRDLRLQDHAALYSALIKHPRTLCVFVFDRGILEHLPRHDRRVDFIWHSLQVLKQQLQQRGSDLLVAMGHPQEEICRLAARHQAVAVYAASDVEPQAISRDQQVAQALQQQGCRLELVQDQVIFARDAILSKAGTPYTVFTPYKQAWLARLTSADWQPYPSETLLHKLCPIAPQTLPSLEEIGFMPTDLCSLGWQPGEFAAQTLLQRFADRLDRYHEERDFPAVDGTSRLSPHLRFGTVSVRQAVALTTSRPSPGASTWLNELIWREFYQQLLWHFPHVVEQSFRPQYRHLAFGNRQDWFEAWCEGRTGYPLVDAAMRQLRQTGWMHNRLRMLVASFLVKDLLVDWRWGEQFFAEHLLDYELASNNGGWQWAASTGCDAQPWFRIFNPVTQSKKFDPQGRFIRQFVPELTGMSDRDIHAPWQAGEKLRHGDYPPPLIDHAVQRAAALALFGQT
ncbi:deoxyribodipyrimidine photo-lyase [Paludibacterium sp. THUN1379]|uniref:cryptochrome/photolyase family protein n=1 Tax=Paludibacterium sp. THUN1379 TaxID=3112107 RepID=UPI0030CD580C